MPEHGEYNMELKKWFCSYWMTKDEWMNIHGYTPPSELKEMNDKSKDEEM